MTDKKKDDEPTYGDVADRIRGFADKAGLDDETVNDMVQSELKEKDSKESFDPMTAFLAGSVAGSDDRVSLEGFVSMVGDLVRNITKGKKPNLSLSKETPDFAVIERTYANPRWVAQRRIVGQPVKFKEAYMFQGNWEQNIGKLAQRAEVVTHKNMDYVKDLEKTAVPYVQFFKSGQWKDEAKAKAFLAKYGKLDYSDKKDLFDDIGINYDYKVVAVPGLDADGVVKAATRLIELRKLVPTLDPFVGSWNQLFLTDGIPTGGEDNAFYDQIHDHYNDNAELTKQLSAMVDNLANYQYWVEEDWINSGNGWSEIEDAMKGLIHYIDASIK